MNKDFNTISYKDATIIKKTKLLNDLEKNIDRLPSEKTGVRKQIDILKQALLKISYQNLEDSLYHLKIARLKFQYFAVRNNRINFAKFINEKTKDFENDLMEINKLQLDEEEKAKIFNSIKKVFKDFLNAVIIKSYYQKNYDSQKEIQNQNRNWSPHRSRPGYFRDRRDG